MADTLNLIKTVTADGSSATMDTGTLTGDLDVLRVVVEIEGGGSGGCRMRFNSNTGNNYRRLFSENGGAKDGHNDGASNGITNMVGRVGRRSYSINTIYNISGKETSGYGHCITDGGNTGSANAPTRMEYAFKWANTAQITSIQIESYSSNWTSGSTLNVYAYSREDSSSSDEKATISDVPVNTRYEEVDTRKIYRLSSLKDNCIAYYNFDSTSGGLVNQATTTNGFTDGLGSAVDGTVSGATTTTGKFSNCYDFDGDDYVNLGTNSGLNLLNGGTVAMWINYDSMTDKRWAGKGSNGAWEILSEGGSGTGKIKFRVKDSGSPENAISTTVLSSSTWYHVAGVYDKSAGKIKIYINGALEDTTSSIGQIATVSTATYFGRHEGNNNVNGRIDDAGIWNIALSDAQISALYNSGTGKLINEASAWKERGTA